MKKYGASWKLILDTFGGSFKAGRTADDLRVKWAKLEEGKGRARDGRDDGTRNFWRPEEIRSLRDGVREFGAGDWPRLRRKIVGIDASRTAHSMSDKWRTLPAKDK